MFKIKSILLTTISIIFMTTAMFAQDVILSFGSYDEGAGAMEILIENNQDVYGFQFNVSGINITEATAGDVVPGDWMLSANGETVLGFSLMGTSFPAGSGVLVNLTYEATDVYSCIEGGVVSGEGGVGLEVGYGDCIGDAPVYGCMDATACNFNPDATVDDGSCEYPEGTCDCDGNPVDDYCDCDGNVLQECWDGSMECDLTDCPEQITTVEVNYDSPFIIGGFQFEVLGGVTILSASGGAAEEAGFMVSAGATTVIGFSLSGETIEPGSGVLTILELSGDPTNACISDEITELVIADPSGEQLYATIDDCFTINCNLPAPPATPENFSATVSGNDVSLSWDASDTALGYFVHQDGELISDTNETSEMVRDLDWATTYSFCVSAYNPGGVSDQVCLDVTTDDAPPEPLNPPENLTAEAGDSVVHLNWDDPPGEVAGMLTVYILTDDYGSETSWDLVNSSGDVVAEDGGLSNATEYTWDVDLEADTYTWTIYDSYGDGICCDWGEGGYELFLDGESIATGGVFGEFESVEFTVGGMVMSITTGYYVEPHGYPKGEIPENWQDLQVEYTVQEFTQRDLIGYNVYRSETSDSGYELIGSTMAGEESYDDETVVNETTYYYVVTATYDGGESVYSNEASATPMPYVPDPASDLTAEPGDSEVNLSWTSPEGFDGFPPCPDGSAEYVDCDGNCFNNEDCAGGGYDGCVEGETTWLGDGFCDDGTYGLFFWLPDNACPEYGNDCGDCGPWDPEFDDPYGICDGGGGGGEECTSIDNFTVVSPDECYEETNYFELAWDGGCELTDMWYGTNDVQENYFDLTGYGFDGSFIFFGFGPNETYQFQVGSGGVLSDVVTATSSSTDCGGGDPADFGVIAMGDMPPELIKRFEPNPDNYNVDREELTAFNVYRAEVSGGPYEIIGLTSSETTTYTDDTVVNGTTYYYVVTAVYDDELESDPSNEASATPMSTMTFSLSDAAVVSGDSVTVTLSMDNVDDVGGIQIDLADAPDFLTVMSVTGTERIPEDWMISANEQDDGTSRIIGFGLSGTNITPGSGPIVDVVFSAWGDYPAGVSLCTTEEVVSDPDGLPYFVNSGCGTVDVTIGYSVSLGVNVITETADLDEEISVELSIDTSVPVYEFDLRLADAPNGVDFVAADAGDALPAGWSLNAFQAGAEYRITGSADGSDPLEGAGVFIRVFGIVPGDVFGGEVIVSYASADVSDIDGNSYYIESLGSDTFEVYPGFLPPPMNLTAESGLDGVVPLAWQGMPDPLWIGYDNGSNSDAIGTGGAADFDVAIKYDPEDLTDYAGMSISKVKFFPFEVACEYSVRIWHGGTMVADQLVPDAVIGDWNEVTLNEPVPLPTDVELYIGFRANTQTGFPAGVDSGPATPWYSDLIALSGGPWESIAEVYALNFNWNLSAYLTSPFGQTVVLEPVEDSTPMGEVTGLITNSGIINTEDSFHGMTLLPDSEEVPFNIWSDDISRELELSGYNVYRSETSGSGYDLITFTDASTTNYDDVDVMNGSTYYYVVSSIYDEVNESGYSNEAMGTPMSWLNLDLSGGEVQGGDNITLTFSLSNDNDVAGVQFDLVDVPDNLYFMDVVGTERVPEDWSISGNEQSEGNARILGFSFTGTVIEPGSGPILEITLGSLASEPTDVEICTTNEAFADPDGNPFPLESVCNTVTIDVESVDATISTWADPVDQGDTFSVTVSMDSPFPIYGFQLEIEDNPEALTAIEVVPSELVENAGGMFQWSEIDGYINALWFTLTLDALEESGDLFTITYQVNEDAEDGLSDICFRPTSVFSDENGNSIYSEFGCSTAIIGVPDVFLTMEQTSDNTFDVLMDNVGPVAGIQFTISDVPDAFWYVSTEPTNRIPGDWMISGSDVAGEITVVGFSLTGTTIDAGTGAIVSLTVDHAFAEDLTLDMCFENAVFSDPDANPWYTAGECAEFIYPYGPSTVTQDLTIEALQFNMASFNVEPEDPAFANILADAGVLLAKNDDGDFFAPDFGVDQIGDVNLAEGYKIFINGMTDQSVSVTGPPVDASQSLLIEAFKVNLLPYLPQTEMASTDAFGPHDDDILLVANDSGDFYVPSFNVFSLDMLYPGEAYSIFLSGASDVDFTYPAPGLARVDEDMSDYYASCVAEHYVPVKTGIPYPVILTQLNGHINIGDEIAAYANGNLVGAIKVMDLSKPAVITAWAGYHDHNIDLPGFELGDNIELRVWDAKQGQEIRVESHLSNDQYGMTPLTSGSITVYDMLAVPEDFNLSQNYPNPFNPSTTIEFSVPNDGHITLNVYDITGRLVNTLVNESMDIGYHTVTWDGTDVNGNSVSAGLYIYALQGTDVSVTRKMVLMK